MFASFRIFDIEALCSEIESTIELKYQKQNRPELRSIYVYQKAKWIAKKPTLIPDFNNSVR